MRIHLLAVGTRMPAWVQEASTAYAARLPPHCQLLIRELAPEKRGRQADVRRIREREGSRLLAAIPDGCLVIALDVQGRSWSTEKLAGELEQWLQSGRDVALLVGGPDGLSAACLARADLRWSLSALTFPHPLVRVILAEQLFRAWSILANHPYHRGDQTGYQ
ncbi:MAG: 23S rRNA (pseudouridine(1915)-N(3))-methyltransferase RlmH [Thiothrix sp.]|nr:23S rRNA (pseudouridine(1915)-N(3))-methyltransferase RlmH [Thiothrix sp.]HPQ96504.1 23S rRNA (pseudouridine(1915)-N(3))-methyltransferase RlmH [Thiolinea sp.]